jgi:hypothetical protein
VVDRIYDVRMADDDRTMPAALVEICEGIDKGASSPGDPSCYYYPGVSYYQYRELYSAAETADWWRAWANNPSVDGAEFRVFGGDDTGGQVAFWIVRPGEPIERQPVVFFHSEGRLGVVARNLDDYLWLLASGSGPEEAALDDRGWGKPIAWLTKIAQRYAPVAPGSVAEMVAAVRQEFPDFKETIYATCVI